ncbi:MAG: FtsX-like permease family protein [Flavobacteriaceae bacterium]|nr:FtsX-like permease family protein [Flavobacteriaceae bacterium]
MSLVIGVIPAVYLSNFKAMEVLKGNMSSSKKGIILRTIMLGIQFSISGFFLIGILVIFYQINYMTSRKLGFSGDQIMIVNMDNTKNRYTKYKTLKNELAKHTNIEDITSSFDLPGYGGYNSTEAYYNDFTSDVNINAVDFNYLDLMKIDILKGRNFKEKFASDTISNVIINETLAKGLGIYNNPIGKQIIIGLSGDDSKKTVIGMVKDYHSRGFDAEIDPMLIMHWNTDDLFKKYNFDNVQFKIIPNNIEETISYIENYWNENISPDYPFSYKFLGEKFAETYEKYEKQQAMFLVLSIIVIIVSMLGLFALATLNIQHRLKEVAIRKTLGASAKDIIFQLLKNFLIITLVSSVVLIPISYFAMQNWLDNFVYKIDIPLFPYIITPVVLIMLVVVIVGFKAFRTTKIDLIKHLKFE